MAILILIAVILGSIYSSGQATEPKLVDPTQEDGEILGLHLIGEVDYKEYYKENETKMDWYDAREFCEDVGLELATVEDWPEFHFLQYDAAFEEETVFWTGGRDFQEPARFVWNQHSNMPAYFPRYDVLNADVVSCVAFSVSEADGRLYTTRSCDLEQHVLCQTHFTPSGKSRGSIATPKEL